MRTNSQTCITIVILLSAVMLLSACVSTRIDSSKLPTGSQSVKDDTQMLDNTQKDESEILKISEIPEEVTHAFLEEHGIAGFGAKEMDVNGDEQDDLIKVIYTDASDGEKFVAIDFGGSDEQIFIKTESVSYPFPVISAVQFKDELLILENTGSTGGSNYMSTVNAYLFDGDTITEIGTLHNPLDEEDVVEVEFVKNREYKLTYLPTGDTFEGKVPKSHYEAEYFDSESGAFTHESIALSVNTDTAQVKMRIQVCIGGELCNFSYLDVTFDYDAKKHEYSPSDVTYTVDEFDFSEYETKYED